MRRRAFVLCLGLAGCGGTRSHPNAAAPDWRGQLAAPDRARLRDWRAAWTAALAKARAAGAGAQIAMEGVLLAPDAALDAVVPPDGAYKCRTIKLGAQGRGGLDYVAYPAFACRVGNGRLVKLTGSQRMAGSLQPDQGRIVFIGAWRSAMKWERPPMAAPPSATSWAWSSASAPRVGGW